jgi:parallel beta-helix repeat protein
MPIRRAALCLALVLPASLGAQEPAPLREVPLRAGMVITESVRIRPGTYRIAGSAGVDRPVITIRGRNLTVDFTGVVLEGTPPAADPDVAQGLAIRVDGGHDITLRGGRVRGYRVGVLAERTRALVISGMDLSHQWKPRLFSLMAHESLVDWMSFHQNEKREWLRFGAAIYLEDVKGGRIVGTRAVQGMNGLLMTRTDSLDIRDNDFSFNSALGIGMYRSSDNVIVRNRVDFNVRGYQHGYYRRGQDSAGLLMYEQSHRNVVAWNSMTHGGDGLFLWAGQHTMDTGQGGANDNLFFHNDFSFAPTNGMEATFSRNAFVANIVEGNDHGLWGGYSWESRVVGNCFARNRIAIALEHGQDNQFVGNRFAQDSTAIALWANPVEPSDWGYPKHRDTRSRDYRIADNRFGGHVTQWRLENTTGLDISGSRSVAPGEPCDPRTLLGAAYDSLAPQLANTERAIPTHQLSRPDRAAIIVDEWGPYDWRSPKLWPVDTARETVRLRMLGPAGEWRATGRRGVARLSAERGRSGDTITVTPHADSLGLWHVELEYVGAESTAPNGVVSAAGTPVPVRFERFELPMDWRVRFVSWADSTGDPMRDSSSFAARQRGAPLLERREARLDYMWYRSLIRELPQERWGLEAVTRVVVPAGVHSLRTISDDAVRVWVDGRLVIDHWTPHGSELAYAPIAPGPHEIRVQYAQIGGWSELRVEVIRGASRSPGSAGPH